MANEKRLIDANDAEQFAREHILDANERYTILDFLRECATVDAVEVVRCKDCVNWHKDTLFCDYMPYGDGQEHVNWYDEDFCSYGERRTDGD